MRLALRGLFIGGSLIASACSDSTSTTASKPTSIVFIGSNTLSGTVGQVLPSSLQIEIRDSRGQTLPNIPFTVTVSSGTIAGAPAKTAVGTTSIGTWTLGTAAGSQQLTVASTGLPSLVLSVTAVPGAAAIVSTEGVATSAVGTPGAQSPLSPQIRLTDGFGNPIAGLSIPVTVTGGGSVQFPNPVTNSNGFATAGLWTLGPVGGTQTVTLSAPGVTPLTFTVNTGSQYDIIVRYVGTPPSGPIQQVFADAVARIRQFITGDLSDVTASISETQMNSCLFTGLPALNETIDDLIIFANIRNIDGAGGVLGRASPCFVRTGGGLPVIGEMEFDAADLNVLAQVGQLNATITHEMLHVLGFGVLWTSPVNLLQGAGGSNPLFLGPQALAAYRALGGVNTVGVPVENCVGLPGCGSGTRDAHWRELTFSSELMTGFLNDGVPNPLSRFSIASMADLGYTVTLSAADAFTLPGGALRLWEENPKPLMEIREDLLPPLWSIGPSPLVSPKRLR